VTKTLTIQILTYNQTYWYLTQKWIVSGPTQYILQRTDTISDIFIELFDSRNMDDIVKYTNAEAATHGQDNFSLDIIELKAFIGLCLARGVTKGRNEPVSSFWSEETGRAMSKETMNVHRDNVSKSISEYYALSTF